MTFLKFLFYSICTEICQLCARLFTNINMSFTSLTRFCLAILSPPIPQEMLWSLRSSDTALHWWVGHSPTLPNTFIPSQYLPAITNSDFLRWSPRDWLGRAHSQSPAPSLSRQQRSGGSLVLVVACSRRSWDSELARPGWSACYSSVRPHMSSAHACW